MVIFMDRSYEKGCCNRSRGMSFCYPFFEILHHNNFITWCAECLAMIMTMMIRCEIYLTPPGEMVCYDERWLNTCGITLVSCKKTWFCSWFFFDFGNLQWRTSMRLSALNKNQRISIFWYHGGPLLKKHQNFTMTSLVLTLAKNNKICTCVIF